MLPKKLTNLLLLTFFSSCFSLAQNNTSIDSLNYLLEVTRSDSVRVVTQIELAKEHSRTNLPLSLQYAQKAHEEAKLANNIELEARALMNIGTICFQQGLLEPAAEYFSKSLSIYKDLQNVEGKANVLTNIGSIQLQLVNLNEAKGHFMEALELYNGLSSTRNDTIPPFQLITIYNNLGIVFENEGSFNEAIKHYQRGIALARRIPKSTSTLAMLFNNLGSTYMKMGRHPEALEAMREAHGLRMAEGDSQGLAMSYRMMGIFYMGIGQYDSASLYFWKGYSLAKSVGSTILLSSISEKLFEMYSKQNLADSALHYHKQFKIYTDQMNRERTLRELSVMELTWQFNEREKMRELEHKRQQLRLTYIGIVLLLVVIIFGLLYAVSQSRNRRLTLKNKNIELAKKNAELERESLIRELEIKNKELTTNVIYQIRKNELINSIADRLIHNSHAFKKENQELFREIVRDLERSQEQTIWDEFEARFHQVHNQFYMKLNSFNPDLSPNERRLCAFLRLNMTTKEISSITGQSPRSIEVARTRLRKKLNLTNSETGLVEFLSQI